LFLFSFLCFFVSNKIKKDTDNLKKTHKIQKGKITYSDLNKPAKAFFSKKYRIAGKPDYIINKKGRYIPVEIKTGRYEHPMKSHIFQIAAYCHLIEENFGVFVPYGILVYNNKKSFKIKYDPSTRFELESTISKMRKNIKKDKVIRNHNDINRCRNCSLKMYCKEKLTL